MATYPSESGSGGPVLVADRHSVAAEFSVDTQFFLQRKEHLLDVLMIFSMTCISGGTANTLGWRVGADKADNTFGTGDEQTRVHALVGVTFHIAEVSVPATTEPLTKGVLVVGEGIGAGHTAVVESHLQRDLLNISAAQHTAYYLSANCANCANNYAVNNLSNSFNSPTLKRLFAVVFGLL